MGKENKYKLTPWGCLYGVLLDHDIEGISNISGDEGEEIANELFEALIKAGYLKKRRGKKKK